MKTKPSTKFPAIWGHRGAMDFAPMNTLVSFREAIDQGADGIELDVHLSADGQVMVLHDDSVDTTSNGNGLVAEMSVEQLQGLDAGAWFSEQFRGERIPRLIEVFEALPENFLVNVELKSRTGLPKSDRQALVGLTIDVVRTCHRQDSVIFSSFDPRLVRLAAKLAPEIDRALLIDRKRPWWLALASLGLDMQAIHPHFSLVNSRLIDQAKRRNWKVNVWTVNDSQEAARLAALGVDALICNSPRQIRAALS